MGTLARVLARLLRQPPAPISLTSLDAKLKQVDLELKLEELKRARRRGRLSESGPLLVGILAALIGFTGNMVGTFFQGQTSIAIERQKQQGSLIIEAIKTNDPQDAAKNLRFLLEAGLVDDKDGRVKRYLTLENQVPVLPAASGRTVDPALITERLLKCVKSLPGLTPAKALEFGITDAQRFHETIGLALYEAAENGDIACVATLLEAGANPEGPFFENGVLISYSPTMRAAQRGDVNVLKMLLSYGADPNLGWKGNMPLHEAARSGSVAAVRLLINEGARINAVSEANNFTPLMTAILACKVDVVRVLLANNADVTLKTAEGETAVAVARRGKCESLITLLSR